MTVSIQDAVANEGDSPGLSSQNTYLSIIPRRQRAQSEVVLDHVFWIWIAWAEEGCLEWPEKAGDPCA